MQTNKYLAFFSNISKCLNIMPNFVLMGPPGAVKGTFADMLVQKNIIICKYVQGLY